MGTGVTPSLTTISLLYSRHIPLEDWSTMDAMTIQDKAKLLNSDVDSICATLGTLLRLIYQPPTIVQHPSFKRMLPLYEWLYACGGC